VIVQHVFILIADWRTIVIAHVVHPSAINQNNYYFDYNKLSTPSTLALLNAPMGVEIAMARTETIMGWIVTSSGKLCSWMCMLKQDTNSFHVVWGVSLTRMISRHSALQSMPTHHPRRCTHKCGTNHPAPASSPRNLCNTIVW